MEADTSNAPEPSEAGPDTSRTSTVSETLNLPGYLLDPDLLRQIDGVASETASTARGVQTESSYSLKAEGRDQLNFKSLDSLLKHLDGDPKNIRSIQVGHATPQQAAVQVEFRSQGDVRLFAFGGAADFRFNVGRLREAIAGAEQEYSWIVKRLAFQKRTKALATVLVVLLSGALLMALAYYANARTVGVNIDPSLIPRGNEPFKRVADALKSNDTNEKLNALLVAQLRGFANVRDVLAVVKAIIFSLLVALAVAILVLAASRVLEGLYPKAFFLFGHNVREFQRLQTRRQVWAVAVVIGFLVNVAAGIVVAFTTK